MQIFIFIQQITHKLSEVSGSDHIYSNDFLPQSDKATLEAFYWF